MPTPNDNDNDNLWGDLSGIDEDVLAPKAILKKQGAILTKATRGLIVGNVHQSDQYSIDFCHTLTLHVPSLNNYRYRLIELTHPIQFYPCYITCEAVGVSHMKCDNENELIAHLAGVLQHENVRRIVSRLLAQAKS